MATIQVRDIPDDVYESYRRQARDAGQSLQAYMRRTLVEMARVNERKAAMLRELDVILAEDGASSVTIEQILADLDDDRRR